MKTFTKPYRLANLLRTFSAVLAFFFTASLVGDLHSGDLLNPFQPSSNLWAQDLAAETRLGSTNRATRSNPTSKTTANRAAHSTEKSNAIPWKYTRFGWQDSRTWFRAESHVESTTIEKIHPTLIGANILLAALGAIVWLSDERDVYRWLRRTES